MASFSETSFQLLDAFSENNDEEVLLVNAINTSKNKEHPYCVCV